ncbi:MAG: hypothetical protein J7494_14185 [Sphingobium sp.]|nr:hypothetical protein [Sphingobium sp.]
MARGTFALGGALGAILIGALVAGSLHAQPGAAPTSPPIAGLKAGTGAPFPKGHNAELDKLPDWGGIWFVTFSRDTPRPAPPKLKGKYKAANEAWKAEIAANNGIEKRNRSNCTPPGMPGFMSLPQYPYEFLFTPGRVTINQEAWMQTRKIWTDGRPHQDDPDPSFAGDSVGHWENGTLVAETIAINDKLPLQTGMTHSDKLKVTERLHLSPKDPNLLINEITLEDPDALEEPWHNTVLYRRDRYGALLEFQCSENDRNPVDEQGNTGFE